MIMAQLVMLGDFFLGLGVLLIGLAALWGVAVWNEKGKKG